MKSFKLFNLLLTISIMLLMMAACESDIPAECQNISIVAEANSDSTSYSLIADLQGLDNIDFEWFVNDQLIANGDSLGTSFDFSFAPGVYNVCINAESEECGTINFCTEVVIRGEDETGKECPELKFEAKQLSRIKYLFEAGFAGMDTIQYVWYVDGDSIESEQLGNERHHKFDYEFRPGVHTVCIKSRSERCGELEYCKEIEIGESNCPEVSFYKEADGERAYLFVADFDGKDTTQYKWYVNGEFVDKENFEEHETDHKLYRQFDAGHHEVCLESLETDECGQSVYCVEFDIEGETEGCPNLYFSYQQEDNGEYNFFADFEGMNDLEWYAWYVNGEEADNESGDQRDNFLSLDLSAAGTYEICLKTETPSCPEGTAYCKTITVDSENCVDLTFSAEEETNGFIFTADFEARDEVTYIWKVYKGDDYQGGETRQTGSDADHDFFWEFESGVEYKVCLRQDGCANNIVCETFMIQ